MRRTSNRAAGASARARSRAGFTLAEVAVTIVIVGAALLFVLQGLNTAKFDAANTYNRKVALGLALQTLGQFESGLFREDVEDHFGPFTYAEEGYEDFSWEVALGDEALSDLAEPEGSLAHDSWRYEEEQREEDEEEEDEEAAQPFEKVRIRVLYPKLGEYPNELVLERWIPWDQVYGVEEEEGSSSSADEG